MSQTVTNFNPGNLRALAVENSDSLGSLFITKLRRSFPNSRTASGLHNAIPVNFHGKVRCNAHAPDPSFTKDKEHIELVACWAHARRNFYEARKQVPQRAKWILRQIGKLYAVEASLREIEARSQLRAALRASHSTPIYLRIHRPLVAFKKSGHHLPRSSFGKAIDYTLSNWKLLGVNLQDGRVEIDNNLVENAIRPTALGKKNRLFFGDAEAGERSAILYTIIACCRRRGIDPSACLRDVLTRLPHAANWTVTELTPENWLNARQNPHKAAA